MIAIVPANAQNTKGDRPSVGNQGQVKWTKNKSFKRKSRSSTKDIAGRRLRTRGQSSANRANAQYRQPPTAKRSPERREARAAQPRGRTFTKSPRESKSRAWKGDVSGYPMRRMKPSGHDAARSNVYPQKGPYVRYVQRRPKSKPPVYKRTIKGKRFVEHKPRAQERAWIGGLEHGPIRNQSATGTTKNTYSQRGPYVAYYHRRSGIKSNSYSNRSHVSKVQRYTRAPKTGGSQPRFYPASRTKPYVQRGRKNVYWGKYQKKTRAVTTDITGGPLRTRNYKSQPIGLVGRDTLVYFGRKPSDQGRAKGPSAGYRTTARASKGWRGDVAGWPVRSPRTPRDNAQGALTPTQPGIGALWLKKVFNYKFKGVKPKDRIPNTSEARYSGNIPRGEKGFSPSGTGYSGNIKGGRAGFNKIGPGYGTKSRKGGPGYSKAFANYSGNMPRSERGFDGSSHGYSGNMKRTPRGFSPQGANYSGNIKRGRGFNLDYAGYSGNIKRGRGFNLDYVGYSGNIKRARGFSSAYAGYSGNMKRSMRGFSPQGEEYRGNIRRERGFNTDYVGYSGNLPKSASKKYFEVWSYDYKGFQKREMRGFSTEGMGYSGNFRRKRPAKGGGSISGMWNNEESPLGKTPYSMAGANFSGSVKAKRPAKGGGSISGMWNNNESPLTKNPPVSMGGADFSGRTKARRPAKGGGSVSGILWNNQQTPLSKTPPASMAGADFSGRTKYKRPAKGGGSVSGILWNNQESPLGKTPPANMAGSTFSGRTKAKRPEKGGGSVSGILWNNKESALAKSAPATANAPEGLHVKVKEAKYGRKKNAHKDALPGIAPLQGSVKASEYSRSMKLYWNYKHNPNASRDALKGIGPGKAEARIRDYQGNTKMRKHTLHGLHPDAKFAHSEEDNVKSERGLITNVKLFWQKMFHKNGTQPSNVKDKGKKLEYDKREKGLWAY